jgi:restriction system protein
MVSDDSTVKPVPTYDEMLWPTLQAIIEMGGSATIQEITDKVVQIAGYTDEQLSVLHRGGPKTEIAYRLAWSRTYLRIVGALENSRRGVWSITEYGRTLRKEDTAAIPARVRSLRPSRTRQIDKETVILDEEIRGEEIYRGDEWRDPLLAVMQALPPTAFERLCQRVLRESNFTKVEVTGRSGDGGIDGIGVLRIGLISFQVFFQCKRYKGSVGAPAIRDFRGAMVGRTDKGLFLTTGTFTPDAKREATRDGAPVLDLIDGDELCTKLKDLRLGVNTERIELEVVKIEADWFQHL